MYRKNWIHFNMQFDIALSVSLPFRLLQIACRSFNNVNKMVFLIANSEM